MDTEPPYRCAKRVSVVRGPAYLGRLTLDEQLGDTRFVAVFDHRSPKANVGTVSCRKTLGNRTLRWFNGLGSKSALQLTSDKAYYRKSEVPDF
jgi:hypothetical protein